MPLPWTIRVHSLFMGPGEDTPAWSPIVIWPWLPIQFSELELPVCLQVGFPMPDPAAQCVVQRVGVGLVASPRLRLAGCCRAVCDFFCGDSLLFVVLSVCGESSGRHTPLLQKKTVSPF